MDVNNLCCKEYINRYSYENDIYQTYLDRTNPNHLEFPNSIIESVDKLRETQSDGVFEPAVKYVLATIDRRDYWIEFLKSRYSVILLDSYRYMYFFQMCEPTYIKGIVEKMNKDIRIGSIDNTDVLNEPGSHKTKSMLFDKKSIIADKNSRLSRASRY